MLWHRLDGVEAGLTAFLTLLSRMCGVDRSERVDFAMNIFNRDLEAVEAARLGPLDLCVHKSVSWVSRGRCRPKAAPWNGQARAMTKWRSIVRRRVPQWPKFCGRFSFTMPSEAAKNARTVEMK